MISTIMLYLYKELLTGEKECSVINLRKPASLLITAALILNLAACGTNETEPYVPAASETAAQTVAETEPLPSETEDPGQDVVEEILSNMSVRDKICQMMIVSYRADELCDEVQSYLTEYPFGGFILFSENIVNAEQTVELVSDIQTSNQEGGGLPMIIGTDQEGGGVNRIAFGTAGVSNMSLAATGNPDYARQMYSIYGEELRLLGINTDFAPVLDINNNPANPVIGNRAFSDVPDVVSMFGISSVQGLSEAGIIATLKHFPGHGNTDVDSHLGFPLINCTLEELNSFELVPFQAAIDAGARMIMTAHIQYPQIETATYTSISTGEEIYLPATMSRVIMNDILRDEMGFEGVIVSDALDMDAIDENFAVEDILALTVNAGVDMLMLPSAYTPEQFADVISWVDIAVDLAQDGTINMECVDDAVMRILRLKYDYGILDLHDFEVTDEWLNAVYSGVGNEENRQAAYGIAYDALTLLKNENGAFPLSVGDGESVLIIFAETCASRAGAGELVSRMHPELQIESMVCSGYNDGECIDEALNADHVILVYRTYNGSCLDPSEANGVSSASFDRIIDAVHEAGRTVILVSCALPYDAARFLSSDAVILCYGSSPVSLDTYCANLPAALCACFGDGTISGRLPVDIPALDENYAFTSEILYPRENLED